MLAPWKKCYDKPRQHITKQNHYLLTKIHLLKAMVFPVVMYRCENWTLIKAKRWRIDAFQLSRRRLLRGPLRDCKEIKPVNLKGNQPWIFIGRTGAETEAPVLWPPDAKSWLIGKDPDGGRDWGQEEKGSTEDEMAGWHHRVWVNSQNWWWTGRPGVLRFMGWQRFGNDWATKLNWTELNP